MIEKVGRTAKIGRKMSLKLGTAKDSMDRRSKCGNFVGDNSYLNA